MTPTYPINVPGTHKKFQKFTKIYFFSELLWIFCVAGRIIFFIFVSILFTWNYLNLQIFF